MNIVNINDIINSGKKYDIMLVGAGLFNAVIADLCTFEGYSCLVIDKRNHIGGNCYTEFNDEAKCFEHVYGPHIFHTNDESVWNYVNSHTPFYNFINSPIANYNGSIYNLPFNMNTFSKLFNITNPEEAREAIMEDRVILDHLPDNLEEQALAMVGKKIYKTLIKGYTEKQWGKSCKELPADIIKRIPLRFTYDNNYFNDKYQGIPQLGYTELFNKMFRNCDIILGENFKFFTDKIINSIIVYTGRIDEFFNYDLGKLDYRGLKFVRKLINQNEYQGNAVVNYTSGDVDYTRIVEHKYFMECPVDCDYTLITKEYPVVAGEDNVDPYYPVRTHENMYLYNRYRDRADKMSNDGVFIEGRLGRFEYNDMDKTIIKAIEFFDKLKGDVL